MNGTPLPTHLQQLLSKYDDFLSFELSRIRNLPENQANSQGEHTELVYNLIAALSKTKGLNFVQAVDTVFDYLKRNAAEIHLPQELDAGPDQMKRMREKMAVYTVNGAHQEAPARKWWQFLR